MNQLSPTTQQPTNQWWTSSNFWTAVALFIGALFVGFPTGAAEQGVGALFGVFAAAKAVREYFKQHGAKVDVEQAVNNSNLWNYLGTILVTFIPMLPVQAIDHLETIAQSIVGGNWQGAIVAVFSLVTILYNLWRNRQQNQQKSIAPA